MDAAARAELAALRRRAYGPDADIAGDPVALERLAELEELALPARPAAAPVPSRAPGAPEAEAAPSDPLTHGVPASDPVNRAGQPAPSRPLPRRRLIIGLVTSVTVIGVALGAAGELQTALNPTRPGAATASPTARLAPTGITVNDPVTIPLLIDSLRGEFIDVGPRPDVPRFLANSVTIWVQPLGVRYGWALWVAAVSSGRGPEYCLILTDGTATEAQCIPREATADGALEVSLAYDEFAESQRPPDLTLDQRLTFGWGGGAYATMEITDSR